MDFKMWIYDPFLVDYITIFVIFYFIFLLNFLFLDFKHFKIRNKIEFESRMSIKDELTCSVCELFLSRTPVVLPCAHALCSEHLEESTASQNGSFRCAKCDMEFETPINGFPPYTLAVELLDSDAHLNDEEKAIKRAITEMIQQLEKLQNGAILKQSHVELTSFDHFSEIRRQIDIQREELKKVK